MRDAANGRKSTINPTTGVVTNTGYNNPTPIYVGVTNDSQGKLVLGVAPADAIGGVLGVVTEAYYNADNTDSFKIMFIDPAQVQ